MHQHCPNCQRVWYNITLWPVHCICGTRIEQTVEQPLNRHSDICRTNPCGYCSDGVTCQKTIQIGLKKNQIRKGLISWLDDHPEAPCPADPPQWKTYPAITVRNLIYHLYPKGDWRLSVDQLLSHRAIFNGRKIIAIAIDSDTEPLEVVKEYIATLNAEIIVIDNDKELRETATFPTLLVAIQSTEENEATFYSHSKGNSTEENVTGAILWRSVMYDFLLGKWEQCMTNLIAYPIVGTHKMVWPDNVRTPYPNMFRAKYQWMHAGTFWWFRHDAIFTHPDHINVPANRYAVEAWPSQMFDYTETKSMWQPWAESPDAWPHSNPYDPNLYKQMGYIMQVPATPDRSRVLKIGFDLDQTIYGFPELLREVVYGLAARGHKLYCTSNHLRSKWPEDCERLRKLGIDPDLFDPQLMQQGPKDHGAAHKKWMAQHVDYIFDDFDFNDLTPTPVIKMPGDKANDAAIWAEHRKRKESKPQ